MRLQWIVQAIPHIKFFKCYRNEKSNENYGFSNPVYFVTIYFFAYEKQLKFIIKEKRNNF